MGFSEKDPHMTQLVTIGRALGNNSLSKPIIEVVIEDVQWDAIVPALQSCRVGIA